MIVEIKDRYGVVLATVRPPEAFNIDKRYRTDPDNFVNRIIEISADEAYEAGKDLKSYLLDYGWTAVDDSEKRITVVTP